MPIRIQFLQDMETWDGTYKAGSEHECGEARAAALAAEGFVRICLPAPVAPVPLTRSNRKPKLNSSHD